MKTIFNHNGVSLKSGDVGIELSVSVIQELVGDAASWYGWGGILDKEAVDTLCEVIERQIVSVRLDRDLSKDEIGRLMAAIRVVLTQ